MSERRSGLIMILAVSLIAIGCQGKPFSKPPIHLNLNMDNQERYDPQAKSAFFADEMTMRMPVPGTVARGELRENDAYYRGKDESGQFITYNPEELTEDLIRRGQDRYDIFCSPCHSRVGDGKGIIMEYKYPIPPPSFHTDNVRNMADGYLYDVITNGVRNMPSYGYQIPVIRDRWAVVAYIRALQKSQNASLADIPESKRQELK